MAEIKPSNSLKPGVAVSTVRSAQVASSSATPRVQVPTEVAERPRREMAAEVTIGPIAQLISDFVAATPRTSSWLSDPRLVATLQAASQELAPAGKAKDLADRYAASVIETHLVARNQLMKQTNAMLKT